ncbi:MAG: hypothetical protein QNJ16_13010 [Rhodobacter sp.]|nr:hypothetical protein [Rhodobacter sp.]
MNKMNPDERRGYLAGIVTGMAQARWIADRPDNTGSACINDWYFRGDGTAQAKVDAWFERQLDKPAGALMFVLIKKECGW